MPTTNTVSRAVIIRRRDPMSKATGLMHEPVTD